MRTTRRIKILKRKISEHHAAIIGAGVVLRTALLHPDKKN